jgi:hypothetical protein
MPFNVPQISKVAGIFSEAEILVGRYFRMSRENVRANRYDVKTMVHLEKHEVDHGAFAHLCRYYCQKGKNTASSGNFHFYRICLQDDRILDAVERAKSFIKFSPLILYIAAHELVHIIRFNRGDSDFDAPLEEKRMEEQKVHNITRSVLQPVTGSDLGLVIDCFSSQYQIGDIFN